MKAFQVTLIAATALLAVSEAAGDSTHSLRHLSAPQPSCSLQVGIDYAGNDIGNAKSATAAGCCDICAKNPKCRVVSWNNYNGGTCWLKNLATKPVKKAGVTSVIVKPIPKYTCNFEPGFDYLANDIGNVPNTDPDMCCAICTERADCKAFTWSEYNNGTCWLKKAKETAIRNGRTLSGTPTMK